MVEITFRRHIGRAGRGRRLREVDTGLDRIYLDGRVIGYRDRNVSGAPWTMIRRLPDAVKAMIYREHGADVWITEPAAVPRTGWPDRRRRRRRRRRPKGKRLWLPAERN